MIKNNLRDSKARPKLYIGRYEFEAVENEVLCWDNKTQSVHFRCRLDHPTIDTLRDLKIEELHVAPNQQGVIVLLAPARRGYRPVGNLMRVDLDGSIAWWAELPSHGTDNYTSVRIEGSRLYAGSSDSFDCWIDEFSGRVIAREFTK